MNLLSGSPQLLPYPLITDSVIPLGVPAFVSHVPRISILNFRKDRERHINTAHKGQRDRRTETKYNQKQKEDLESVCVAKLWGWMSYQDLHVFL